MLHGTRLLVVEREFLIALEVQRILESADARQIVAARSVAEVDSLSQHWPEFDLAVIEDLLGDAEAVELAAKLRAAGVAVVVTTADHGIVERFNGAPTVEKPFSDETLLAACRQALNQPG
jgi:DNA-binding response OmpR family regulator